MGKVVLANQAIFYRQVYSCSGDFSFTFHILLLCKSFFLTSFFICSSERKFYSVAEPLRFMLSSDTKVHFFGCRFALLWYYASIAWFN